MARPALCSELEALGMDLAAWDPGSPKGTYDGRRHGRRPADEHVVVAQTRDVVAERGSGQRVVTQLAAVPRDDVQPRAARSRDRLQLVAEDHVDLAAGAVEEREVAGLGGQR